MLGSSYYCYSVFEEVDEFLAIYNSVDELCCCWFVYRFTTRQRSFHIRLESELWFVMVGLLLANRFDPFI